VDGTVDTTTAEKRRVRGIYDSMDVFGHDVAEHDLEVRGHEPQRRFPDRCAAGPERADSGLGADLRISGRDPGGCSRREEETPCARVHNQA
jgi:hypothetical protein